MTCKLPILVLLIVVLLGMTAIALAQDENPSLCTDGTWYCPDANDSAREAWNWDCGWWWGHYYAGMVFSVPVWCIPPEPVAPEPGPVAPTGPPACTSCAPACYPVISGGSGSLLVNADMTVNFYTTNDCSGTPLGSGVLTSGMSGDCFAAGYSGWSNGHHYFGISCDICS